jgi:hypothetical protein
VFFLVLFFFWADSLCLAGSKDSVRRLCPFKTGQYAEYEILGLMGKNKQDRYRIEIEDEQMIEDECYYWIKFEIFSKTKREMCFKALTPAFKQEDFDRSPQNYISQGMLCLFKKSKKMFICLDQDDDYIEIDPDIFFSEPDILKSSLYSDNPFEANRVDYSKLKTGSYTKDISVKAGDFKCQYFQVATEDDDEFSYEGFDLWRSPEVPFLGIVRMEFSKTNFIDKWYHRHFQEFRKAGLFKKIQMILFERLVFDGRRRDVFIMRLVDYKAGS